MFTFAKPPLKQKITIKVNLKKNKKNVSISDDRRHPTTARPTFVKGVLTNEFVQSLNREFVQFILRS